MRPLFLWAWQWFMCVPVCIYLPSWLVDCWLDQCPVFSHKYLYFYNLQSKVKNLCTVYKFLLKTHRDGFLKALACDHAVDHPMVCKAAKSLLYIEVRFLYNDEFNMSVSLHLTCGYDEVSNRIIKLIALFIILPLTYICNAVS